MSFLRGLISPLSSRGLTTVSRKTTKNINNIDIFSWIP
ncbi:proline/betaine transporter [Rickettsia asembonensis]